jgi:hypothetical protein
MRFGGGIRHVQERGNITAHTVFFLGGGLRLAAPCLRLVTGFSPRRSGFNYKPVHVGICGGRSGKGFPPVLGFNPSITIHDCPIHTHSTRTVVGGRDHLEALGIDGRILKSIFKK